MLYFSTAHEYTNKNVDKQQAFNSTMDLWNNFAGSNLVITYPTMPPTANINAIIQALDAQYSNGGLWKWDGSGSEGSSEGIIMKSNGMPIY